jgi:hypothetical protein
MDIDDLIYPLVVGSFPNYEEGEILDIVEGKKGRKGVDAFDEFEQEVWQKYLALKREFVGGCNAEASQPRSVAAKAQQPP